MVGTCAPASGFAKSLCRPSRESVEPGLYCMSWLSGEIPSGQSAGFSSGSIPENKDKGMSTTGAAGAGAKEPMRLVRKDLLEGHRCRGCGRAVIHVRRSFRGVEGRAHPEVKC